MKNQKGFTLIELLVVIAIIGVLAVVAIPKLLSAIDKAKQGVVKADVTAMNSALQMYSLNHPSGAYVTATKAVVETSLAALIPKYLGSVPKNPWQDGTTNAYQYEGNTTNYTIYAYVKMTDSSGSLGADEVIEYHSLTNTFSPALSSLH